MLNSHQQTLYAALCETVQISLQKTGEHPPVWLPGFSPVAVWHLEEIVLCAFRQPAASPNRIFIWTIDLVDSNEKWDDWDTEAAAIEFYETIVTETFLEDLGGDQWWTMMKHIDIGSRLTFIETRAPVSPEEVGDPPDGLGHWSAVPSPEAPLG